MDDGPDAHADEHIGRDLLRRGHHLPPGVAEPVPDVQLCLGNIHGPAPADELLHLVFQVHFLDQRTARHGNHQPQRHIDHRHLPPEDAHQQHQAAQVHHG